MWRETLLIQADSEDLTAFLVLKGRSSFVLLMPSSIRCIEESALLPLWLDGERIMVAVKAVITTFRGCDISEKLACEILTFG